ncbi:DUF58 domain-containing protein [Deltaproteobacteria bacterium OttesenSCG-928-M10]|nr:DUF58 domain-containing protein [Deltaproteobacteria bacterium OttesenSCG-928-M10]
MIRPTAKAALLFALSIPLAVLVVTFWPWAWFTALYPPIIVLALLGADAAMILSPRRLAAEIKTPKRLHVGQAGEAELHLKAPGHNRPQAIDSLLELEGDIETPRTAYGLMTGGELTLKPRLAPTRRGRVLVTAVWLRWRGPLGLAETRRRDQQSLSIDVIPDVRGIHEAALQFFARDASLGQKTQRLKGEGTEFHALGEYVPGMDNRFIDWKHSARHRKLLCKEFRQERNHQIVFGFDTGHLMLEPIDGLPKLDHAIKAGLLLSWISLYSGDLVGGCGFDARMRGFVKPGRGMPYFTQMQRFAASLEYRTEETNFTLGLAELRTRLQRRALVILFTEFVDMISAELLLESLQLMVRRHVVVFVTMRDPMLARLTAAVPEGFAEVAEAVIAEDFQRERSIVLERVARLGVHCLDVPTAGLSSALLNRYLMIKQRGLL